MSDILVFNKGKLCPSKPLVPFQYPKYQPVTDILNFLGIGVKVSFRRVDYFAISEPSNSGSRHYTTGSIK
jgi:hypothetical protein